MKFIDLTEKYINMIDAFECDFSLALDKESDFELNEIQEQIDSKTNLRLLNDIALLKELSFNLRHNKLKIISVE